MLELTGTTALVAGGASGMGAAVTEALQRQGVEDIAEAVLALFALGWVTGQTLVVDGGLTLVSSTDLPGITPQVLYQRH